jgi:hypothetical protein
LNKNSKYMQDVFFDENLIIQKYTNELFCIYIRGILTFDFSKRQQAITLIITLILFVHID